MENDKIKAVLAYLFGFIGGLLVYFTEKENKTLKFHAAQSIAWSIVYLIIRIVYGFIPVYIPFLMLAVNIFYIYIMVKGITTACANEEYRFPIISDIADKLIESFK
ncbi:DUF4870 domain-containing protein [Clostridium sp.]|uniref:DUF4870 domain-containing protein n=1 Tax=Clostridium sp. TaxID=1506 RepID=UPI001B628FF1|nr:DUF4870 domain-containing protein [Clostridium sp.]MBP3916608.1 DUF4870 domain-containing protein [Clostridium sp.]